MLYDTHVHLNDEQFKDDLDAVLADAREAGVALMNVVGYDLESSAEALALAERFEGLRAVVGIHPHDADQWGREGREELLHLIKNDRNHHIAAVGEIGLDYHFPDRLSDEIQVEAFKGQMRLAYEADLPFVVHDRDAHEASLKAILEIKEEGKLRAVPGVFHCYSGSLEFAERLLDLGFYLGFDGPVTYKNGKRPLETASKIPLERLLLETDCPYLSPEPKRGRRNEPANLRFIAAKIAEARGLTYEELCLKTSENARRLFG